VHFANIVAKMFVQCATIYLLKATGFHHEVRAMSRIIGIIVIALALFLLFALLIAEQVGPIG
jgi:hypothetical protein